MAKNRVVMRTKRGIELRKYDPEGGIEFYLEADGEPLGVLMISGANVYFEGGTTKKYWPFNEFVAMLKQAKGRDYSGQPPSEEGDED